MLAVHPSPWPEFDTPPPPIRALVVVPPLVEPRTEALHPVPYPRHAAPAAEEPAEEPTAHVAALPDALALLAEQLRTGHLWELTELDQASVTIDIDGTPTALILADHDVVLEWSERFAKPHHTDSYVSTTTGSLELCCSALVDGLRWEMRTHDWHRGRSRPPLPTRTPGRTLTVGAL
jgi:hypothetical protein